MTPIHTIPPDTHLDITAMQRRWLSLKSREIIDELVEIRIFSDALEDLGYSVGVLSAGVDHLIARLRGDKRDSRYTQVVHIITKYLNGIRNFVSHTRIRGGLSYTALVESTMIAIGYELDCIDARAA